MKNWGQGYREIVRRAGVKTLHNTDPKCDPQDLWSPKKLGPSIGLSGTKIWGQPGTGCDLWSLGHPTSPVVPQRLLEIALPMISTEEEANHSKRVTQTLGRMTIPQEQRAQFLEQCLSGELHQK